MQKVLVVDDSALMRRKTCDIINADKDFQVSDMGISTLSAYNKIMANDYAVAVIGMSSRIDMEGLLKELDEAGRKIKIIILTTSLPEDMKRVNESIRLGAYDYVCRENRMNGFTDATAEELLKSMRNAIRGLPAPKHVKRADPYEVTRRIRQMNQNVSDKLPVRNQEESAARPTMTPRKDVLIALACSTGGPQALQEVIPMLPEDLPVPVVLVQHMPAGFTDSLARRLDLSSKVHVKQAEHQEVLQPGYVYIAPGGKHMEVAKSRAGRPIISINDKPPVGSLKPCADLMYESLCASDYKEIICVVLTGMGADGTKGIQELKRHKKIYVITESQETCVVYGMPRSLEQSGLSDKVVPINQIVNAIIKKLGD